MNLLIISSTCTIFSLFLSKFWVLLVRFVSISLMFCCISFEFLRMGLHRFLVFLTRIVSLKSFESRGRGLLFFSIFLAFNFNVFRGVNFMNRRSFAWSTFFFKSEINAECIEIHLFSSRMDNSLRFVSLEGSWVLKPFVSKLKEILF